MHRPLSHGLLATAVLLACATAFAGPVDDGKAWLEANQNPDGSWGVDLQMTVTSTTLETLTAVDPCTLAVEDGASWLADRGAPNNEFLARQAGGLAEAPDRETKARESSLELLSRRNAPETDPSLPNWPEGGWGIDTGFATDCLTTSVAMLALDRTGFNGGFTATGATVAGGSTNVHEWEIACDAFTVRIEITVGGATVRLRMAQGRVPDAFDPYFELPPGGPYLIEFPGSGLDFECGTNYITIENPDGLAPTATYTMTASYQTPDYDTRSLAEPLDYLRQSQNADGGWGSQRGQATDFYTTLHVLLAALRYNGYEFDTAVADAVAYVKSEQLADGSFGLGGTPVPYVTALASLGLVRAETPAFSAETTSAITALLAQQQPDGSWAVAAYDTALAMQALWEHDLPPTADAGPDQEVTDGDLDCTESIVLSGSGNDPDGTIQSYDWTENCVPVATGSSPMVPLGVGVHRLVLTVTGTDGQVGRDSVQVIVNDGAADNDGDFITDICTGCIPGPCFADCDDNDPNLSSEPSEVDLRFSDKTNLVWSPPLDPGGTAPVVYDTLRSGNPADFQASATCLESDDADTSTIDVAVPASGDSFNYLVRSENACPGPGTLGFDSSNNERTGVTCP